MAKSFFNSVNGKNFINSVHVRGLGRNQITAVNGPAGAELINDRLLSRTDMIKIYAPPLKAHQLPENNPFYTRNFVEDETMDEF